MERQRLDMMQFFEGYVRNYRKLSLSNLHNYSMFTKREMDYFSNLGEMLGYFTFLEDSKYDLERKRSRPMDLAWWKWDARKDKEHFLYLALHLERENQWRKDEETVEKLFSKTDENYIPHSVIGIQRVASKERIPILNDMILHRNRIQKSQCLMIYRYMDSGANYEKIEAYVFCPEGTIEQRNAVCIQDVSGYFYMSFEEEIESYKNNS